MSNESVLIISTNKFPNGDAGAVRQQALAKALTSDYNQALVVGLGKSTSFKYKEYDNLHYISLRYGNDFISKVKSIFLYKYNIKKILNSNKKIKTILVINIPFNAFFYVKRYAKKNNIKLIYDSVEWFSPEQFKHGKFSLGYALNNKYNTKWIDKSFSVIAISSYLEKHFKSKNINTIKIPVILDVIKATSKKEIDYNKLIFVYAGSPGKKDYLKDIIKGFAKLEKSELKKIELRIIGINKEQLFSICDVNESDIIYLENSLVTLGRVTHDEVLQNLEKADFTVLLRSETQRYAQAGFPTKVVESLASATPVICNITSDLGMYIKDSENGFIVNSCSSNDLAKIISKCIKLTKAEREILQKNARKTAEDNFDYRLYIEKIKEVM